MAQPSQRAWSDERIRESAVHCSNANTAAEAVKEYERLTHQRFTSAGRGNRTARYRCIRSTCRQVADLTQRLPMYQEKNTSCPVRLSVYRLEGEHAIVLRRGPAGEELEHNHKIETRFHRQQKTDVAKIKAVFRSGIPRQVVYKQQASQPGYNDDERAARMAARSRSLSAVSGIETRFLRDELRRIERRVEAESYQKSSNETESVKEWVNILGPTRVLYVSYSTLDTSTGQIVVPFQLSLISYLGQDMLEAWEGRPGELSVAPVSIDATFNVTANPKMLLYTVISRDSHGHGVPLAHLLTDSKTSQAMSRWLADLRSRYTSWRPGRILTDTAPEQIQSIRANFPEAQLLLCSWHVRESWRRMLGYTLSKGRVWFVDGLAIEPMSEGPHQHDLLTPMLDLRDEPDVSVFLEKAASFRVHLQQHLDHRIRLVSSRLPPPAVALFQRDIKRINYLLTFYIGENPRHRSEIWAHCFRTEISIQDAQRLDTTMLSEAYHRVLKYCLLKSPRQNRMDHVIKVLMLDSSEWFSHNRALEKEGRGRTYYSNPRREELAERRSFQISIDAITWIPNRPTECVVAGGIRTTIDGTVERPQYFVNVGVRKTCTCPQFARFPGFKCKHIFAAIRAYHEPDETDEQNIGDSEQAMEASLAEIDSWDESVALSSLFRDSAQEEDGETIGQTVESISHVLEAEQSQGLSRQSSSEPNIFSQPIPTWDEFSFSQLPRNPSGLRTWNAAVRLHEQWTMRVALARDLSTVPVSIEAGNRRTRGSESQTSRNCRPRINGRRDTVVDRGDADELSIGEN